MSTNVAATGAVTVTNIGVLSITGTANQVAASASTGAITLSLPQNVIIPTPAAGTALIVSAVAGGSQITGSDGTVNMFASFVGGTTYVLGTASAHNLNLASSGNIRVQIGSTGNITINSPSSGTTLVTNAIAAGASAQFTDGTTDFRISHAGGNTHIGTSLGATSLILATNGIDRVTISGTGNATIASPSSGIALTVSGSTNVLSVQGNAGGGSVAIINAGNASGGWITWQANGADTAYMGSGSRIFAGNVLDFAVSTETAHNLLLGANGAQILQLTSGGGALLTGATGGDQGAGTLNAINLFVQGVAVATGVAGTTGSFSAGTTGLSGATAACKWTKIGTCVTMFMAVPSTLASSATGFTLTGLPAAIQPTTSKYAAGPGLGLNNNALINNVDALVSGSTITFSIVGVAAAWTAAGNKTVGDATSGATFVWDTD